MAKFYVVKNGRKVGIFSTWEECQKQVVGFKGAIYKSFKTKDEAEELKAKFSEVGAVV